jgi:PAS domain S-box-containing protein
MDTGTHAHGYLSRELFNRNGSPSLRRTGWVRKGFPARPSPGLRKESRGDDMRIGPDRPQALQTPPNDSAADVSPAAAPVPSRPLRLLLPAAVVLPLAALGASAWFTWQEAWRSAERELVRTTDASAEYVRRVLDGHRTAVDRINDLLRGLTDAEIRAREPQLHQALREMVADQPQLQTAYVGDRTGRLLVSASVFPVPRGVDFSDREFHAALAAPGAPAFHVTRVYQGRIEGNLFFAVARPRRGTGNGLPPGTFDGQANVAVDPGELAAGLAQLVGDPADRMGVVREDGHILARHPRFTALPPVLSMDGPLAAALRQAERGVVYAPSRLDGLEQLIAFRRVEGWPGLHVSTGRPRSVIVAGWLRSMVVPLALGFPAALALVWLALLVVRRQRALMEANAGLERRVAARTSALEASEAQARDALAQLDVVYATTPVGLCVLDTEGRFTRINDRLAEINGLPAEAHLGRTMREVVPGIADAAEALLRRVVDTGEPALGVEVEGETPAREGVRRAWLEDWSPLRDGAGRIVAVNVVAREVTEERAAARALAESEARFRALVQASSYAVYRMSADWSEMRRLDGAAPGEDGDGTSAGWLARHIPPEDQARVAAEIARAIAGRRIFELEHRAWRADGTVGWTLSRAVPILDAEGGVLEWFGASTDVTERRADEERQLLLAREVDHRAKNTLAVVQAALRLTRAPDVRSFVRIIEGRISALARAHTLLAGKRWEGAPLRVVVEAELTPFLAPGPGLVPRAELDGPGVMLAPPAVQALSMIMHELATNATKHGALSVAEGRLSVSWRLEEEALCLRWAEQGGPPVVAPPARRGFGSRVLEATITGQLGGTVAQEWREEGLVVEARLPRSRVLQG